MILKICPECDEHLLKHIHDCVHGIPETHMVGSERYECDCGFKCFVDEGKKYNLKFILDKEPNDD